MPNIREMLIGFGKSKQSNLATANAVGGIWQLSKLNANFASPRLNTENNAAELGKGHEFASAVYKTSWDFSGQLEKYTSAEFAAWVMAFSLGHLHKSGTTPNWVYTCTPLDKVADGEELSCFSYIEQVRPGAGVVLDWMAAGCVVEGWNLAIQSGPGRASSKLTADIVGSGQKTEPSTITIPAITAEKLLPASSVTATINGVDYVTAKNLVSIEAGWKNNHRLDDGFYPGSGTQDGGAIRGRMEVGDREASLSFTARFAHDSTERTKLYALTDDANNDLTLTFQRVIFSAVELGDSNGIITVKVTCQPLWHTSNGLLTAVAKCNIDGIAEAEA
jgi:hypothetical protein